jgi:hypothetical protein
MLDSNADRPVLATRMAITPDAVILTTAPGKLAVLDRASGRVRDWPDGPAFPAATGFVARVAVTGDDVLVPLRFDRRGESNRTRYTDQHPGLRDPGLRTPATQTVVLRGAARAEVKTEGRTPWLSSP